jgi:hypothetical protein
MLLRLKLRSALAAATFLRQQLDQIQWRAAAVNEHPAASQGGIPCAAADPIICVWPQKRYIFEASEMCAALNIYMSLIPFEEVPA